MECQDATAYIADYLAGTLSAEELDAVEEHAAACAACRGELAAAEEMWQQLGQIPRMAPRAPAMRTRFDAALAGYLEGRDDPPSHARPATERQAPWRITLAALAAAAVLVIGIAIGRQTSAPAGPREETQVAALREELGEMRQVMSLSLLQQPSATARLQGVVSTAQIKDPHGEVIAALLDTLMYDPNVNVRLATIDALTRFMDRELVKQRTLDALPRQTSPLVQIALIDFVVESSGADSAAALRTLSKDSTVAEAVKMRAAQALRHLGVRS